MASLVPGTDVNSDAFRRAVAPLNPPAASVSAPVATAAQQASTDSFHLAMLTTAVLLAAGGAVNWFGLRGRTGAAKAEARAPANSAETAP
jgi:hypothetical protein